MSYIKCEKLILGYDGVPVTGEISFEVNKGDYLCIVGENGAGKSTFVKTLLGLVKPLAGRVLLEDGLKQGELGYLPQQNSAQRDFPATVSEIVLSGTLNSLGHRPFYGTEQKKLAEDSMERLGILELKNESFRRLSGGQQQRVLLARALCTTEKLLLLDEPVAGLDPKVTAEFYELIKELHKSGVTVIMVTHDLAAAAEYSNHILHLGRDRVFFGSTEEYAHSKEAAAFDD